MLAFLKIFLYHPRGLHFPNANQLTDFFHTRSDEMKEFGMLQKVEESHKFLKEHMYLVCDHLASFLIIWCVDLQVEGKTALMYRAGWIYCFAILYISYTLVLFLPLTLLQHIQLFVLSSSWS